MKHTAALLVVALTACAGMRVEIPEERANKGTKQIDLSSGSLKVIDTYTCSIVAENGKRVSAIGKSESEAKENALGKCRDQTLISICKPENLRCVKN